MLASNELEFGYLKKLQHGALVVKVDQHLVQAVVALQQHKMFLFV